MGTTPKGIRYPDSTAFVRDGATAMQTLATDVDSRLMMFESTSGARPIVGGRVITRTVSITLNQFGQGTIPYGNERFTAIQYVGVTRLITTVPATDNVYTFSWYTPTLQGGVTVPGPDPIFVVRNAAGGLLTNTAISVGVMVIGSTT